MALAADHTIVELAELGRDLGVGGRVGPHTPVVNALRRLERFGAASWNGHTYAVRRALAPVSGRRLEELPEFARAVHRRAQRQEACIPVTA